MLKPSRPTEAEKASGVVVNQENGNVEFDAVKLRALLGKKCFIGLHLREALIISVCDGYDEYQQLEDGSKRTVQGCRQQWRQLASGLNNTMLCGASEPGTGVLILVTYISR